MKEGSNRLALVFEEKKAIKLFLWLFYIFYISYDLLWGYLLPKYTNYGDPHSFTEGLGYWVYVFMAIVLLLSSFFIKKGNPFIVKYFILFTYTIIDVINNIFIYYGTTKEFASGNLVELLFIVFSPIFVNRHYFWSVALTMIGKYFFIGVVLQTAIVLKPIVIVLALSAIVYLLLTRFYSYIYSLTNVYEELRRKEKLALIGQMAAAVGHEIRNPLASLKGFIQLQHEKYPNMNEYYPIMVEEIDRIDSIVSDLMYIGKPKEIHFAKANISDIIAYTVSITNQQAANHGVTIETVIEEVLPPIDCDENRLKQVFINLIKNAIESMPDGGKVTIHAQSIGKSTLCILIEDEGCGIAEENIRNLCEPFYSTKKEGTGLGLMVTNQIITDHNGMLDIQSTVGEGTKVWMTLPIVQKKEKMNGVKFVHNSTN
ncbi:ATP-binding protein [Neobacillus fumarioli]|uniref:ATP-binding protein n=1 Tax=Neobacillus fumarioli TaxID=105229 RepID=UPI00082B9D26|nr:ATP-binding protein [Neobacillus fumarioli]